MRTFEKKKREEYMEFYLQFTISNDFQFTDREVKHSPN